MVVDGKFIIIELFKGNWCLLVSQPCLWTGGIHTSRLNILDDGIPSSTLSLPIYMCGPYGSNYGGYERLMYPFYSRELVRDCESFKQYYESIEPPHMAHSSDFGYAPN